VHGLTVICRSFSVCRIIQGNSGGVSIILLLYNLLQANPKLKIDDRLVKFVAQKLDRGDVNESLFDDVQDRVRQFSYLYW
jgi:hypothetical protein